MKKRYLLFASYDYAYHILRPLQREIRRQGHEVCWFLEDTCPDRLFDDEKKLVSFGEVKKYNPLAVLLDKYSFQEYPPWLLHAQRHTQTERLMHILPQ